MNKLVLAIILSTASVPTSHALVLANWNFNSIPTDGNITTGSLAPDQGRGQLLLIGGVKPGFVAGDSMTASADNSALNTYSYPPQKTGDKTAGIELKISTLGHYNIRFVFAVRVNAQASKRMMLQYTVDGSNYVDRLELPLLAASGFLRVSNNFASLPKADDNPNFGFRLVAQHVYLSTNPPITGFEGSGEEYSPDSWIRFDDFRIWADSLLTSQAPTRPMLVGVTVPENTPQVEVPFPLSATGTAAADLTVEAYSSNEQLVPRQEMVISGGGNNRTLTLRPVAGRIGNALITLCQSTPKGHFTTTDFPLTVTPIDPLPLIGPLTHHIIMTNQSVTVPFTIGGGAVDPGPAFLTADVSNPTLTPAAQVSFGGNGSNRTVTVIPAQNQIGSSTVTLMLWDRYRRCASNSFVLSVHPSSNTLVCETFSYHPGSLVTNAPGLWATHSGTAGQIPVIYGQPWLVGNQSEDVSVTLPGGPYTVAEGDVLYAGFTLVSRVLPSAAGAYFAHFNDSAIRARLWIARAEVTPNAYRIGIANNTGTPVWHPTELQTQDSRRIVIRYAVATGETTFWMEPLSEQDPGIVANDPPSTTSVSAFGFRQAGGMGSVSVDDLLIGTSFEAVARRLPPRFLIQGNGNGTGQVIWMDDIYGYVLEFSSNLTTGPWVPIGGEPPISGDGFRFSGIGLGTPPTRYYRLRATNNPPWTPRP